MTRDEVQKTSLQKAKDNNYNGILCLEPGSGKTKVSIDCIKQGNFKNILITSPRTNLKQSWQDELIKWGFRKGVYGTEYYIPPAMWEPFHIEIENIQTCYKWYENRLKQFDLIIIDEIHCIGQEYFQLIEKSQKFDINGDIHQKAPVPILGLTGTPTLSDPWKKEVLYKALPIIYEYYSAEEDGITNKIQCWKLEYNLTDAYKVLVGTKTKKWYAGELTQYNYLSEVYEKAKLRMFELGASDYFETSMLWMKGKQEVFETIISGEGGTLVLRKEIEATKEQKEAGRKFFNAVRYRKEFLWNLTSSKTLALLIKNKILNDNVTLSSVSDTHNLNWRNKVLLFSELTQQAEKLSLYSIHSNNGKNAKQAETINKELLDKFNNGEIRELSSCLSLTLGLNMVGASHAVFESYSSSKTNFIQKSKRLARLDKDKTAHVVVIVPKGTQAETWSSELLKGLNYITITDLKDLKI